MIYIDYTGFHAFDFRQFIPSHGLIDTSPRLGRRKLFIDLIYFYGFNMMTSGGIQKLNNNFKRHIVPSKSLNLYM